MTLDDNVKSIPCYFILLPNPGKLWIISVKLSNTIHMQAVHGAATFGHLPISHQALHLPDTILYAGHQHHILAQPT